MFSGALDSWGQAQWDRPETRHAHLVEHDDKLAQIHRRLHGDQPRRFTTFEAYAQREGTGSPHLALISAPCTDFAAQGGMRGGAGSTGHYFLDAVRDAVDRHVPALCTENTANIAHFPDPQEALQLLTDAGYHTWFAVMQACDVRPPRAGDPQTRPRSFLAAIHESVVQTPHTFRWPAMLVGEEPTFPRPSFRAHLLRPEDVPPELYLDPIAYTAYPQPRRRPDGTIVLGTVDPRLGRNNLVFSPDGPTPTLRARVRKAEPPGSVTSLVHDGRGIRCLTVPECLTILGHPPTALVGVDEPAAYLAVGNSISVSLASAIVAEIVRHIRTS